MMRVKINLVTLTDAAKFTDICSKYGEEIEVKVKDNKGNVVNGKSLMGMIYSLEFAEMWCESNTNIYSDIKQFVIE